MIEKERKPKEDGKSKKAKVKRRREWYFGLG